MNPIIQNGLSIYAALRKRIGYLLLLTPLLIASCIRDDLQPCPPLQVQLTVTDKNYFNVNSIPTETRKSETLAFKEYIPTLYYTLRDVATGNIIEEQGVFNITGNETNFLITFCDCLPLGKYVLTVWGGLPDNTPLTDNSLTSIIHKSAQEGKDIYLVHDTLIYDAEHTNYTLGMERVTGKLVIQVTNLPENVQYANNSINNIYERVNFQFAYMNPIAVNKIDTWEPSTEIVTRTILAPSTGNLQSLMHLDFYDNPSFATPTLTPKDVYITIKRNEITLLKYVYDEEALDFSIYVMLNDKWETIYDLDIN